MITARGTLNSMRPSHSHHNPLHLGLWSVFDKIFLCMIQSYI